MGAMPTDVDPAEAQVRALLLRLLGVDSFPKTGEILRADARLLGDASRRILEQLVMEARRHEIPHSVDITAQLAAFLERSRADPLDLLFPAADRTVDPQVVSMIRAELEAAQAADIRYRVSGHEADLDTADQAWKRLLAAPALAGAYPGLKAALLNDAGGSAIARFWHLGDDADLTRADELYLAAIAMTPRNSARRIGRLGNLAMVRREEHLRFGRVDAIEHAETLLREAVALVDRSRGEISGAETLTNLALLLRDRYLQSADPAVLQEAIAAAERACAASEAPGPRIMLGDLLSQNFPHSGAVEDLVRAVDLLDGALDQIPDGAPERSRTMVDLAVALAERHSALGDPADLDEAVRLLTTARRMFPPTAPDLPSAHVQLAVTLYRRFEWAGRLDDLDAAAGLLEGVIRAAPSDEIAIPTWRTNLAAVLVQRSRRTGSPADLDRAIEIFSEIAAADVTGTDRYAVLNNLGNTLRDRSRRSPTEFDLDRAVAFLREAIELCGDGSVQLASTLANLGVALHDRFVLTRRDADLQESLYVTSRALLIGSGEDADHARRLFAHALAGQEASRPGPDTHRDDAVAAYRKGCRIGLLTDPESTLIAAQDWGVWAAARDEWDSAAEAYGFAVDAIGVLVSTQAVRVHQETWLRATPQLPERAAWVTVAAGRPTDAAVALERGRAALLSERLQRDRADLARIGTTHPELRDRYRRAVGALAGARIRSVGGEQ